MKNSVKSISAAFLVSTIVASSAFAADKTIKDDAGRDVTFPENLERVIGLHDATVTLPLYELGFDVVGSHGRNDPASGEWEIFGLQKLFGKSAEEAGIANIGGYQSTDLETIKKLNPQLIVGYEGSEKEAELLEQVAPVFVQRSFTGDVIGNSAQVEMAERFGATDRLEELQKTYNARIEQIKAKLPYDPATKEYTAVIVFDQINVLNGLSGIVQAFADLGFKQPKWVAEYNQKGFMVPLSPEEIGKIDSDVVVVMPGYSDADQSEAGTRAKLDAIAPGWDKFMKGGNSDEILITPSLPMMTPTFASAHAALDVLEPHLTK